MQELDITNSRGKKLSQNDFDEFEKEIGSKLPDDFKEFYLKTNGGMPRVRNFDIEHEIFQFHHLKDPFKNSILDNIDSIKTRHENFPDFLNDFPKWGLPFGSNPFGGLFILDTRSGQGYGNVWYFDPEIGENGKLLASSFKEFINSLKTDKEIEEEY